MGFKEKLGPKSWPLEAVVGVGWRRRGNDSMGAASWLQFREKLAGIWLQFSVNEASISAAIFATIAPRSGYDRASIVTLVLRRSPADRLEMNPHWFRARISSIAARSRRDRGSIGLRSLSSSTMLRRRPMKIQLCRLDAPPTVRSMQITIVPRWRSAVWLRSSWSLRFDNDRQLLKMPRGVR